MSRGEFDIYQTPKGAVAVTNPVQRQILEALAAGDKQLPELVELTGKAKPTLSGIHMKELLARELVTEHPHESDSRRKVFRAAAQLLGSSGVPVDRLRSAVQEFARTTMTGTGLPLDAAFRVLAAAPPETADGVLRAQAHALGAAYAQSLQSDSPREFATTLSQFVEKEGLAQHLQIDFEALSFRCRPGAGVDGTVGPARLGLLLAGFAEGAAVTNGMPEVRFSSEGDTESFRLQAA